MKSLGPHRKVGAILRSLITVLAERFVGGRHASRIVAKRHLLLTARPFGFPLGRKGLRHFPALARGGIS